MNLRFWFSLFISIFFCLLIAGFFGFSLTKFRETRLEHLLLKKSVKLENLLYLKQLNKRLNFLVGAGERIQKEGKVLSDSPFFALVVSDRSGKEGDKVYISANQFPSGIVSLKQDDSVIKEEKKKQPPLGLKKKKAIVEKKPDHFEEKRKVLIKLSQEHFTKTLSGDFQLKVLKLSEGQQPLILFIKSVDEGTYWTAFLKRDKRIFKLPFSDSKDSVEEVFVSNSQGQVFFHNQSSKILKPISQKSSFLNALKELSSKQTLRGKYLTFHKKTGHKDMYYLQKWNKGDMILVVKMGISPNIFSLPFFSSEDSHLTVWGTCFVALFLFFIFFCLKIFSVTSAYEFLKLAFLSFSRTGVFPSIDSSKNPLLYFYNNRRFFLNKRKEEEQESVNKESESLNFKDIVKQELEKLKTKYPQLIVEEKFDFDVKVFGFEKFARTVIYELMINALEAMGGLEELKLDLSIKGDGKNLIFSVRDYGPGVHKKDYKKLFRVYYSSKSQLGVGLNLVQSIVQSNEGVVELSSPDKGGLEVCIRLPLKCFLKHQS